MNKSIFQKQEKKSSKKNEHAALMTVIGPANLLILLGIIIFLGSVIIFSVTVPINITTIMKAVVAYGEGSVDVVVENEGVLSEVTVSNGDYVERGDLLGVITTPVAATSIANGAVLSDQEQSMVKRQTMIVASENGVITELNDKEGAYLPKNRTLCQILRKENKDTAVVIQAYTDQEGAANVKQGDKVFVALDSINSDKYGYLRGVVRSVQMSSFSQDEESLLTMRIIIDPKVDDQGNYIWTKENNGFSGEIIAGTYGSVTIFTDKLYLVNLIIS